MNNIVPYIAGRIELEELSLAASFFEGSKVFPAMGNRVKIVSLAVEPDRWTTVARTTFKKCLMN